MKNSLSKVLSSGFNSGLISGFILVLLLGACSKGNKTADKAPNNDVDTTDVGTNCTFYDKGDVDRYIKMAEASCLKKALIDGVKADGSFEDSFWKTSTPLIELALDSSSLFFAKNHKKGPAIIVALLVQYGADINRKLATGDTAFERALKLDAEYDAVGLFLIGHPKTDLNLLASGGTPLEGVIAAKREKFALELLSKGADPTITRSKWSLAHQALDQEMDSVVKKLLDSKIDWNAAEADGDTFLARSVELNKRYLFDALLAKKVSNGVANLNYKTPLMMAVLSPENYYFEKLLALNAAIDAKDSNGESALSFAVAADSTTRAVALLNKGAQMDHLTKSDSSSLLHKVTSTQMAKELFARGLSIHSANKTGQTPLSVAVINSRDSLIQFFIEKGADINWQNSGAKSLLHLAVENQSLSVARILVAAGLSGSLKDNMGNIPLVSARSKEMAEFLIANGSSVKETDNGGWHVFTALLKASPGNLEMLELLLTSGATPNDDAALGFNALHFAVQLGYFNGIDMGRKVKLLELLFKYKAEAQVWDGSGKAPIHYVDSLDLLKVFHANHIDLSLKTKNGRSLTQILSVQRDNCQGQIDAAVRAGDQARIERMKSQYEPLIKILDGMLAYLAAQGAT